MLTRGRRKALLGAGVEAVDAPTVCIQGCASYGADCIHLCSASMSEIPPTALTWLMHCHDQASRGGTAILCLSALILYIAETTAIPTEHVP